MADQRITQLNELSKAGVSATDVLPIADVSASETKKVTAKNLVDACLDLVDPSSIDLSKLDQNSATKLGTAALADDAITAAKLAADSSIAVATVAPTADNFEGRGYYNSTSGNLQVHNGTSYQQVVMPTAGIGDLQVTTGKLADGAVTTAKVTALGTAAYADSSITTAKIADGATTTNKLADAGVTTAKIAPSAVTTNELANASVTYAKIQNVAADSLLGRTTGTGVTQEISCTAAGRALLDDADAAAQRATLGLGAVATANQVSTAQIQTAAITADKFANESVVDLVTTLPAFGVYVGQFALVTTDNRLYSWTGAKWTEIKAAGSVNDIISNNAGIVNTSVSIASGTATLSTSLDDTAGAAQFLAGPTAGSGTVAYRTIAGADLPTPTTTTKGAVIVNGNGLTITGNTIAIDNTVTAETSNYHIVQYDANGLVTGGRQIIAADVPVATPSRIGVVQPGSGLGVDVGGIINHSNSVTAGTATKFTFDAQGHVTATQALNADDIPALDASKITTGAFDAARIADGSLTKEKFANYATTVIQEADPGAGDYIGQFWYRESDAQLRTWSANSWIPVGFGRLSQENLRFCGTFNAATGSITQVTTFGTAAGLKAGAAIPAATEPLTGAYLVATTPGTYNGDVYDNGDWALCIGTQWIRVDTLSSAGGGSTINLGDLLNVTLTTPQSGDSLIFDGSTNTWKNRSTHGVKITLIEAFDGVRASFTTSRQVVSENNLIVSVGGVIQEPGVDFTAPTGGNTINFVAAPPAGSDYWILQEASLDSGGGGGGGGGGGTTLPPGTAAEEYLKWNSTLLAWQPSNTLEGGSF